MDPLNRMLARVLSPWALALSAVMIWGAVYLHYAR